MAIVRRDAGPTGRTAFFAITVLAASGCADVLGWDSVSVAPGSVTASEDGGDNGAAGEAAGGGAGAGGDGGAAGQAGSGAAGAAGSGAGGAAGSGAGGAAGSSACGAPVSYSGTIVPLFSNNCAGCHYWGSDPGPYLTSDPGCGGTMVVPGDAASSTIFPRLQGNSCGTRMPQGGPYLSSSEIASITAWICEGAPTNN